MNRLVCACLGLLPLLAPRIAAQNVPAQEFPSAAAILDRYVAVTGGQAAYDRIENQITAFTVSQNGQVVSRVTMFQTRDGRYRALEVTGDRTKETGLNDGVAWAKYAEAAQVFETGEDRAAVLLSAMLLPDGQWRRFYTGTITVNGYGSGAGPPCYEIATIPFAGKPRSLCFDQKTGLLATQVNETEDGQIELKLGDYFEAGGILMARKGELTLKGSTALITLESVQFNQSIPDSTFDLPVEITRLLKKKAGG